VILSILGVIRMGVRGW